MRSFTVLIFSGLFVAANAHFQLQFPPPRGNFVENSEPTFCDGYDTVASNRTSFPLTGGIISFNSEHPKWTATVLLSNTSNPTSFDNFTQVTPFFQESIEGSYCIHFDLSSTNATGLQNGNNVTIQILYNGGDGNLYQCADLTLDTSANVSSQSCTNSSSTSSSNSSSSSGSSGSSSAALELSAPVAGALLGLAGLAIALL